MKTAVFYPCSPYNMTEEVAKEMIHNKVEDLFPVSNFPPRSALGKREEFLRLLRDPAVESLMVWRGGRIDDDGSMRESSYELFLELSESDWDEIKKTRKSIIGYSDASYLLCALLSHGINCFYGPNYNSQLQSSQDDDLKTTLDYLSLALGSKDEYVIQFDHERLTKGENQPWTINCGRATGRLVGGNLDTIYDILNNQRRIDFLPLQPGDILLLEDIAPDYFYFFNENKKIEEIKGLMFEKLTCLEKCGVFSHIGGLLFGRSKKPLVVDPINGIFKRTLEDCADNQLEKFYFEECIRSVIPNEVPLLANIACGHTHPMVTLPLGKRVTMDASAQTLTVYPSEAV